MINIKNKYGCLFSALFIAFGVYFPSANAKESQETGTVHGRKIAILGTPRIAGEGVVSTDITLPTFPVAIDPDGDVLVNWSYRWIVNGVGIGTQQMSNSLISIPPYTPLISDEGKQVQLQLQAVAESSTSFPEETIFSEPVLSNIITVKGGALNFENSDKYSVSFNENLSSNFPLVYTSNNPNAQIEWTLSGPDVSQFNSKEPSNNILSIPAKNYEVPTDENKDNIYEIIVTARDVLTGAQATINVSVSILDVKEMALAAEVVDSNGVAISGNPIVGQTLHSNVTFDDNLGKIQYRSDATYQWKRTNRLVGSTPVVIPGATQSTYTLKGSDQGYTFRVEANAK